ncbi:MAG: hypothetical protein NTX13_00705 [Acidobacteria bacterium]|nr:hypothetical protein [Acidobacteriota bacterium]
MRIGGSDDAPDERVGFVDGSRLAVDGGRPAGGVGIGEDDHAAAGHVHVEDDAAGRVAADGNLVGIGAGLERGRIDVEKGFAGHFGFELAEMVRSAAAVGDAKRFVDGEGAGEDVGVGVDLEAGAAGEDLLLVKLRGLGTDGEGDAEQAPGGRGVEGVLADVERHAGQVAAVLGYAVPVAEVVGDEFIVHDHAAMAGLLAEESGDVVVGAERTEQAQGGGVGAVGEKGGAAVADFDDGEQEGARAEPGPGDVARLPGVEEEAEEQGREGDHEVVVVGALFEGFCFGEAEAEQEDDGAEGEGGVAEAGRPRAVGMVAEAVEPEGGEHGGAAGEQDDGHGGAAGLVDFGQKAIEDAVEGGVAGEGVEQAAEGDGGHGAGGPVGPGEGEAGEGQGEDRDAQKGIGVDKQAGKEDAEQGRGLEAVLAQDVIGDFLAPGEGLRGAHPANGLAAVLHGGKDLQGAGGSSHGPEHAAGNGETAVPREHPGPEAGGGEGEKDGNLMMAAEPGEAEGEAAEGGRAEGLGGAGGAEQAEQDKGNPGGAVEHLRPVQAAEQAGEREGDAAEEGGPAPAAEFAGEAVSEHRHQQVREDVIPVEDLRAEVAVAERHQE